MQMTIENMPLMNFRVALRKSETGLDLLLAQVNCKSCYKKFHFEMKILLLAFQMKGNHYISSIPFILFFGIFKKIILEGRDEKYQIDFFWKLISQ